MAGYSKTPLWKKLGYRPGIVAWVESPPPLYAESLDLPAEVVPEWGKRVNERTGLVHVFVTRF